MPEPDSRSILIRAVGLGVLVVAADLWANRHLGIGWANPGKLSIVTALAAAVVGILDKVLEGGEKEGLKERVRQGYRMLLSTSALVFLYAGALIVMTCFSSVRVLPDGETAELGVKLTPIGSASGARNEKLHPHEGALVPHVSTSPFGRLYEIEVDGFLPQTVDVRPFFGVVLEPSKDLKRFPSVLLRPTFIGLRELDDGGEIVVSRGKGATWTAVARDRGHRTSFIVGRPRRLTSSAMDTWMLELKASGMTEQSMSETLSEWLRPTFIEASELLGPGTSLRVQVLGKGGNVVNQSEITLGNDEFVDVPLLRSGG